MTEKASIGVDKAKWYTSPLPGHIVLVSTVDRRKTPNVAPKSWVSMAALKPAIIGFGCNLKHQTARNILETGEFVITIPGKDLAERIWQCGSSEHGDIAKIEKLGFTLGSSSTVAVPRIEECKAHLECLYESDKRYGDEIWFFGEIVFACIDEKALKGSGRQRYKYLDPIFYLEERTYGTLGDIGKIRPKPVNPY